MLLVGIQTGIPVIISMTITAKDHISVLVSVILANILLDKLALFSGCVYTSCKCWIISGGRYSKV